LDGEQGVRGGARGSRGPLLLGGTSSTSTRLARLSTMPAAVKVVPSCRPHSVACDINATRRLESLHIASCCCIALTILRSRLCEERMLMPSSQPWPPPFDYERPHAHRERLLSARGPGMPSVHSTCRFVAPAHRPRLPHSRPLPLRLPSALAVKSRPDLLFNTYCDSRRVVMVPPLATPPSARAT
jgi:hypothetical protein